MVSGLVVSLGAWGGALRLCKRKRADEPDALEKLPLGMHTSVRAKYGIDELYEMTVIRFNAWFAKACAFLDEWVWGGGWRSYPISRSVLVVGALRSTTSSSTSV